MSNINTSLPPAEQILLDSAVVYDGVEMSIAGIGARYALSELWATSCGTGRAICIKIWLRK